MDELLLARGRTESSSAIPMRYFKLTLAYDGTDFAGWQRQPTVRTVQGEVESAWRQVTAGEQATVMASGRTDAGVHALGQVASVASRTKLVPGRILRALNHYLPHDVRILEVEQAPDRFHALRDTVRKRYRYVVQDSLDHDVFGRRYTWHVRRRLDVERMHLQGQALVGTHDFAAFESSGSHRLTSVRTIFDVLVARRRAESGFEQTWIEVEADGFLYNMVRNITGTLVRVGQGRESDSWVADVLASRDRTRAGEAAPARGLFLVRVDVEWPEPSGEPVADAAAEEFVDEASLDAGVE